VLIVRIVKIVNHVLIVRIVKIAPIVSIVRIAVGLKVGEILKEFTNNF
tara:strand:+ start:4604 stop:4747 length:144 start_codon:yes stop_codon:yes gene_type:complete